MERDVKKVKRLLKRMGYDQANRVVSETKIEMANTIEEQILKFCSTFSFWNVERLWCKFDVCDGNVCISYKHNSFWIDALRIEFGDSCIRVGNTFTIWRCDNMCIRRQDAQEHHNSWEIIGKLLEIDVTQHRQYISSSCPLMLIASEIRRLFDQCHYYTRLTLLCIHRWRKESLVAQLPRDVLIYLLKNFFV